MGFFEGLFSIAVSPIKLSADIATSVLQDSWKPVDVLTLGTTKVVNCVEKNVEDIFGAFEEE